MSFLTAANDLFTYVVHILQSDRQTDRQTGWTHTSLHSLEFSCCFAEGNNWRLERYYIADCVNMARWLSNALLVFVWKFARSCLLHCEYQDVCLLRHISLVVTSVCNFWRCWLSLGAGISIFRKQKPGPVISCRGRSWGRGVEDKVWNRHAIKKSKYFIDITTITYRHSNLRPTDNRNIIIIIITIIIIIISSLHYFIYMTVPQHSLSQSRLCNHYVTHFPLLPSFLPFSVYLMYFLFL
jgi:hypothetical protein